MILNSKNIEIKPGADKHDISICTGFARAELEKYIAIKEYPVLKPFKKITLQKCEGSFEDSFHIEIKDDEIFLSGANERSVLFAVYTFLEEYLGVRFFNLGSHSNASCPIKMEKGIRRYKPDFRYRGLCMENGDYQLELIDWMARNKMNYALITLKSWKGMEERIIAEAGKRGMILGLGGHSYMKFINPEIYFSEHPDWYALIDGKREKCGQLCFANQAGKEKLFNNIYEYLKKFPAIKRLSLWPVDNRHYCRCEHCRTRTFLELNCRLLGELEKYLNGKGLNISVEHIAYNASLSDKMFQVPSNVKSFLSIDTELAYWGRAYEYSLPESPVETDMKACAEIKRWAKMNHETGHSFFMIEYYTDFWMLTNLFPVLTEVIARDMAFYRSIEVDGITTLIVPSKLVDSTGRRYPWQENMALNMYVFAKYCWNSAADLEELRKDYFNVRFGAAAAQMRSYYEILEDNLAELTYFNIPLFRLRFPDIWVRDITPADGGITFVAEDWTPEAGYSEADEARWKFSRRLSEALECIELDKTDIKNLSAEELEEIKKAFEYIAYIKVRSKSIYLQQCAQKAMMENNMDAARHALAEALALEESFYNEDSEICRKWLNKI